MSEAFVDAEIKTGANLVSIVMKKIVGAEKNLIYEYPTGTLDLALLEYELTSPKFLQTSL